MDYIENLVVYSIATTDPIKGHKIKFGQLSLILTQVYK